MRVCRSCRSASLATVPSRSDYWGQAIDHVSSFWTDVKQRQYGSVLRLLEQESSGRRLLDVGGGIGHFARLALDRGWDAASLDVSPAASEEASRLLGANRALRSLAEAPDGGFEVVTMWCVLAHVRDPGSLLMEVASKIAPGGLLWITTPNFLFQRPYASARAAIGRPIDFGADDHIHHFTPRGLLALSRTSSLGRWAWHHRGITEFCALTSSDRGVLIAGKRIWNLGAATVVRAGGPNVISELQGLARKPLDLPLRSGPLVEPV